MLTLIEPGEQFTRIGSTIWVVAHLWGMGVLGVPESDIERKTGAEGQNLFCSCFVCSCSHSLKPFSRHCRQAYLKRFHAFDGASLRCDDALTSVLKSKMSW